MVTMVAMMTMVLIMVSVIMAKYRFQNATMVMAMLVMVVALLHDHSGRLHHRLWHVNRWLMLVVGRLHYRCHIDRGSCYVTMMMLVMVVVVVHVMVLVVVIVVVMVAHCWFQLATFTLRER